MNIICEFYIDNTITTMITICDLNMYNFYCEFILCIFVNSYCDFTISVVDTMLLYKSHRNNEYQ